MKIKYLKLKNWLLAAMASLLGLNLSCIGVEEYGCPQADYNVKGTVSNPDGTPIPGIQVEMEYNRVTTDENGKYSIWTSRTFGDVINVDVIFTDIDSTENGLYKNDTIPVVFHHSDLTGGDGHWYEGSATQTLDITLQPME